MTSSITPITTVSGTSADTGTAGERKPREHGMTVVRDREARALISLGTDTLSEAFRVGHELHSAIYDKESNVSNEELRQTLAEALACVERAEHYLLMLSSNLEENTPTEDAGDSWSR
jgi:hypothetical protein